MSKATLIIVALAPIATLGQEAALEAERRAEIVVQRTLEAIERLPNSIKEQKSKVAMYKRGEVNPVVRGITIGGGTVTFPSKDAKRKAVAKVEEALDSIEESLAQMKDGKKWAFPILEFPLKLGDFGQLQDRGGTVLQVLGDKSLLLKTYYTNQNTLATSDVTVLVKGISTKGMADDTECVISDVLAVTGTETYESVAGSGRTVFVLEPLNTEELQPYLNAARELLKKKKGK